MTPRNDISHGQPVVTSGQSVEERTHAERQAAIDGLTAIIPHVSALNSYVRSRGRSNIARIVYHYKREALEQATNWRIATHRRAQVNVTCRDCGGTGRFHNAWWCNEPLDHCWHCNSSGTVRLQFVESELPGALWLTPKERSWRFAQYDLLPETERNWQVNQPGTELSPEEIAAHLNAIEAFFLKPPPKEYTEYGEFNPHETYGLYVGATDPEICHLCGITPRNLVGGHGVHTGRLEWTAYICKACEGLYTGTRVFDVLSTRMPTRFLTPAVREWVARHPAQTRRAA